MGDSTTNSTSKEGVAEWKYEFTFFDIIEELFFAPLRLCANLIHTWIQQRPKEVLETLKCARSLHSPGG
ncbi:MAG: hypothetical protein QNJ63_02675 [Calothrix sp. MO_192.B10]|nr:hypothetical protein [Calothrix sp. MO_192.B10]